MYCKKRGSELKEDNDNFCPNCGTKIKETEEHSKFKNKNVKIIIGIIIVFIIFGIILSKLTTKSVQDAMNVTQEDIERTRQELRNR